MPRAAKLLRTRVAAAAPSRASAVRYVAAAAALNEVSAANWNWAAMMVCPRGACRALVARSRPGCPTGHGSRSSRRGHDHWQPVADLPSRSTRLWIYRRACGYLVASCPPSRRLGVGGYIWHFRLIRKRYAKAIGESPTTYRGGVMTEPTPKARAAMSLEVVSLPSSDRGVLLPTLRNLPQLPDEAPPDEDEGDQSLIGA